MQQLFCSVILVGNGLATVVVSLWEKELTKEELNANLLKSQSLADLTPEEIEAELEADEQSVSLRQPH